MTVDMNSSPPEKTPVVRISTAGNVCLPVTFTAAAAAAATVQLLVISHCFAAAAAAAAAV
jgi:hypothetical protein